MIIEIYLLLNGELRQQLSRQLETFKSPVLTGKVINAQYSPTDVQKFADGK
jgi:hypothetical protein